MKSKLLGLWITLCTRCDSWTPRSRNTHEEKSLDHISSLLGLIDNFPTENPSQPSTASTAPVSISSSSLDAPNGSTNTEDEIDLTRMLSQIRSRYKLLCSSIGVKPRLAPVASSMLEASSEYFDAESNEAGKDFGAGAKEGMGLSIEFEEGGVWCLCIWQLSDQFRLESSSGKGKKSVWSVKKDRSDKKSPPPLRPGDLSF